jgi:hypothetical protein
MRKCAPKPVNTPLALLLFTSIAAAQPAAITISSERLSPTPVDKRIYGVLLEHIGQQMDIMWAELLQDNSFEGLREFSEQSHRWAEGAIDNSRFWWHSGYELHPWRSIGAVNTAVAMNIRHGMQAKTIANRGDKPAGIAQDGIPVRAGITYHFTGYFSPAARGGEGRTEVTVGLYADKDLTKPYATAVIPVKSGGFEKYSADLKAPAANDNATFAITLPAKGYATVDLVSLMPSDNQSGWRADVVAAIRKMGIASFRYPGGCFASFVDWESMVGPPEQRLPFTNPFWGGLEPNHVGTDEFLRLTELVQAEPLLEVNLISGTPERAAAWVEYCNGSEHSPNGRKRARNGHPKPYGVTHWELDNEVWRRFSAAQYAAECRRYSVAMRAVDPKIKLMAVSYFWKDDSELETLLKGAAQSIDYLAVRTVDRDEMAKFERLAEKYSTPQHKLLIASTEWRNKWRKDAWSPMRIDDSQRKAEMVWGYAFECARTLQEFQRHSAQVRFAMFPTLSNLYGEDLMRIGKSGIDFAPNGEIYALMSDMRGVPLSVAGASGKLDVNALVDEPSKRLVCALVHGGSSSMPVRLDLRQWPKVAPSGKVITLEANGMKSVDPGKRTESGIRSTGGIFETDLPPYSVSKVTLTIQ